MTGEQPQLAAANRCFGADSRVVLLALVGRFVAVLRGLLVGRLPGIPGRPGLDNGRAVWLVVILSRGQGEAADQQKQRRHAAADPAPHRHLAPDARATRRTPSPWHASRRRTVVEVPVGRRHRCRACRWRHRDRAGRPCRPGRLFFGKQLFQQRHVFQCPFARLRQPPRQHPHHRVGHAPQLAEQLRLRRGAQV